MWKYIEFCKERTPQVNEGMVEDRQKVLSDLFIVDWEET